MTNDDNALGLNGFEFVEFTGPDPTALVDIFVNLGFTHIATHRSKNVRRYGWTTRPRVQSWEASGRA
jgi:4-hydroxyphenylpyruvate dioxygenase